jgi:hypothetical protein
MRCSALFAFNAHLLYSFEIERGSESLVKMLNARFCVCFFPKGNGVSRLGGKHQVGGCVYSDVLGDR